LRLTSYEKSKEISQDLKKKNCRPPQVWFILGSNFQSLKVPCLSVQTIVLKYKHHGTTQQSYRSGRRRVLSPRNEHTLVKTTAKDLMKMLEETGGRHGHSVCEGVQVCCRPLKSLEAEL
uniref:Uncharacterized protein n=1 Tax=Oncorhynchus tshawytscha TaxID=74940 RepID=A0AAZ3NQ30_ONCTS